MLVDVVVVRCLLPVVCCVMLSVRVCCGVCLVMVLVHCAVFVACCCALAAC